MTTSRTLADFVEATRVAEVNLRALKDAERYATSSAHLLNEAAHPSTVAYAAAAGYVAVLAAEIAVAEAELAAVNAAASEAWNVGLR